MARGRPKSRHNVEIPGSSGPDVTAYAGNVIPCKPLAGCRSIIQCADITCFRYSYKRPISRLWDTQSCVQPFLTPGRRVRGTQAQEVLPRICARVHTGTALRTVSHSVLKLVEGSRTSQIYVIIHYFSKHHW